jgi:hypothetical protein
MYKILFLYFTVRNILLSFWKWDEIEKYEISGINKKNQLVCGIYIVNFCRFEKFG